MSQYSRTQIRIREGVLDVMKIQALHSIKVNALCERIGIGRSTFYMHYTSIYDVVDQITGDIFNDDDFSRYLLDVEPSLYLRQSCRFLYHLMGYADEVRILIGPNGDNRIVPKIARRVKTGLYIYARKMCLSEADSELFSEFASSGHVSSLMSYVTNKQFRTTSIEEFTEKELKLIFSTLVALKGK